MHKDIYKALLEDEKYQQFIGTIENESEKKELSNFMERFMGYFQKEMFDPLIEKMEDKEFKNALINKLDGIIPNKGKE